MAETTNQVFVTLGSPNIGTSFDATDWATDTRLAKCVDVCQGDTTPFQAALAIQQWLPTAGITWSDANCPGNVDELWGMLDGNGMTAGCVQFAFLHEAMLRLLGASAQTEVILPTVALVNGQVQLGSGAQQPQPDPNNGFLLMFDFGGTFAQGHNYFEGGVRVADGAGAVQFYTEGAGRALVVGVESGLVTAENNALINLARNFGATTFQRWAHFGKKPDGSWDWSSGAWQANPNDGGQQYVPVP